jgi:hypothetical protein
MITESERPPSAPLHEMGTRAVRMKKWRKWAEEMRQNGWTVEEPEAPQVPRR